MDATRYPIQYNQNYTPHRRNFWQKKEEYEQDQEEYFKTPSLQRTRPPAPIPRDNYRPMISESRLAHKWNNPRPSSPYARAAEASGDYWYTPEDVLETISNILPGFWDPCPIGADFNGLEVGWRDGCFINPPFSKIQDFTEKGCIEWTPEKTFIWVVNADFKTDVGVKLLSLAKSVAVTKTPIEFVRGNKGLTGPGNKFTSAFVLWTTDEQIQKAFREALSGDCIVLDVYKEPLL
jgi:hypothetical protein